MPGSSLVSFLAPDTQKNALRSDQRNKDMSTLCLPVTHRKMPLHSNSITALDAQEASNV